MAKQIPMIFNQEMVKAIASGRKTVTRRPIQFDVKLSEKMGFGFKDKQGEWWMCGLGADHDGTVSNFVKSKSPVQVGDLIWVRETFRYFNASNECGCSESPCGCPSTGTPIYKAFGDSGEDKWKPSIHMPKKASRLTLKVSKVGIERLQDISNDQARSEGCNAPLYVTDEAGNAVPPKHHTLTTAFPSEKHWFSCLWDAIYGSWSDNPYVWVIEFEVVEKNILEVAA